ncbi:UDP-2,3-diacylglucosamine diphosphatase LpxI [Kiritimatiellota bacterium B12222]|nr:UDP-2,3-diacylglucosamine diphosphatase LpxI [Kiritimatiellota bacterium B12222]
MHKELLLIAGKGAYPLELIRSARAEGVTRISVVAFKGETSKDIVPLADQVTWMYVGEYAKLTQAAIDSHCPVAVMAGQITPSNLFNARLDKSMRELLARLPKKNADTIFGAVGDDLKALGVDLLPAHHFMTQNLVKPGTLTTSQPDDQQQRDIQQGLELAKCCAKLQAGQSVAIKEGTVIAVEGFEGTDKMIQRAGKLGGAGCVIVKVAQERHDMRWDIPVVGMTTIKNLKKADCSCLAMEAGKVIMLEQESVIKAANAAGICLMVLEASA